MKRTDEQIIEILTEHEAGTPVSELYRKNGVSDASIYIRRHERVGGEAAEGAGGREREVEVASGRSDARHCLKDILGKSW